MKIRVLSALGACMLTLTGCMMPVQQGHGGYNNGSGGYHQRPSSPVNGQCRDPASVPVVENGRVVQCNHHETNPTILDRLEYRRPLEQICGGGRAPSTLVKVDMGNGVTATYKCP